MQAGGGLKLTKRVTSPTGLLQLATTGAWGQGPRRSGIQKSRCWTCPHVLRTVPCSHSPLRRADQETTAEATEFGFLSQGQPRLNLARIPQGVLNKKTLHSLCTITRQIRNTDFLKKHILFDPLTRLIRVNLWLFLHNCTEMPALEYSFQYSYSSRRLLIA